MSLIACFGPAMLGIPPLAPALAQEPEAERLMALYVRQQQALGSGQWRQARRLDEEIEALAEGDRSRCWTAV